MTQNIAKTKRTSQAIDNFSFDEEYLMAGVIPMVENAEGTALVRQKSIATEAKQDEQTTILQTIVTLQESIVGFNQVVNNMARVIANPSYVDKSANQMRAQVTGTVTATVASTTISTIDSYQGRQLMLGINNDAWANTCRRLIS